MPPKAVFLVLLLCWPLKEVFSQTNLDKAANFAKSLIENREYNRALIELERISFTNPSYFNPLQFRVTINYLNFQNRYYDRILFLPEQDYSQIFAVDSAIALKDYKNAETIILNQHSQKEDFLNMLERRLLFCNLMQSFPKNADYVDMSKDVYNTYNSLRNEIDNEMLAVLFGIIPGGGYAYAGSVYTGLSALAVTTLCAGLSYMSVRSGMEPMGVLFALTGTFFYGGSIYGGYRSVIRNNERVSHRAYTEISEQLHFKEDRENIFRNHGIFK